MRHKLIFDDLFQSKKTKYRKGEPVEVIYPFIATDTSYDFQADADDVKVECDGCTAVIRFTMPDHDVRVTVSSRNTMYCPYNPPEEEKWECKCGAMSIGDFCATCGSKKPERCRKDPFRVRRGVRNRFFTGL